MSTPGGIGVYLSSGPAPARVNERPWRGVYHHWGGQPDDLGQELIKRALLFKGNLGGLVRQVIDSAPEGWSSLAQQEKIDDVGLPVSPDDTGNIAYAYIFDVAARRLDAFATHTDANGELLGSVSFSADGKATPPQFEVVEPPSPLLAPQVLQGWEPFDDKAQAQRLDVKRRVERDCGSAGLTVEGVVTVLSQALSETFFQAPWEKRAPAPLTRVIIPAERTAWAVKLGGLEVLYPPPSARGRLISTNISGDEVLTIATPEDQWAKVDVRRSAVTRALGEGGKPVYGLLISAFPSSEWIFAFFDLARGLTVPEAAASEAPWRVFTHPDGRVWAVRAAKGRYFLRLGARDDDPVFKERPCARPQPEVESLIKEQLRDGFVQGVDEPG